MGLAHWDDVERHRRAKGEMDASWQRLGEAAGTKGVGLNRVRVSPGKLSLGEFEKGVPPTPAGLRHVNYSNGKGIHGWYSPEGKMLILSDSRSEAFAGRLKAARAKKKAG